MTKHFKSIAIPVAAVVILLLLVAVMAGVFKEKIAPGVHPHVSRDGARAIPVIEVNVPVLEPVPAVVEAKQATMISPRLMARITAIHVRAGDTVENGQLLVELEKSDLQARLKQAQEQVRAVSARLTEARRNLDRVRELLKDGVVSEADLDRAQANFTSLEADLGNARQGVQEAETAASYAEIRAPIAGRVVDRFAEPGDTSLPGKALLSLYNPLSLRVEAQVREKLALSLQLGQPLKVDVPALEKTLEATLEEIVPAADAGSRSFLVKVQIPFNQDLLPGMYARLLVPAGVEKQLVIPRDRIASFGQLDVVWIIHNGTAQNGTDHNGIVERRFIRTGKPYGSDQIEVTAGLSAGDMLLPVPADSGASS